MSLETPEYLQQIASAPDWMGFQGVLIAHPEWNALGASPALSMVVTGLQDFLVRLSSGEFGLHNERVNQFRFFWGLIKPYFSAEFLALIRAESESKRLPQILQEIINEP